MARPRKKGLSYFPMDCEWDDKARSFEAVFKNDGLAWMVKFWQAAYKDEHGQVDFDGCYGVIHPENCRITREKHLEMLKLAIDIGLVYKNQQGKYTSNGIQRRMDEIIRDRVKDRNRKEKELSDGKQGGKPPENEGEMGERERESKREKKKERSAAEDRVIPEPEQIKTAAAADNVSHETIENTGTYMFRVLKLSLAEIQQITEEYGLEYIEQKIELTKKRRDLNNKAAFFIHALKTNAIDFQAAQDQDLAAKKEELKRLEAEHLERIERLLTMGYTILDPDYRKLSDKRKAELTWDEEYFKKTNVWRYYDRRFIVPTTVVPSPRLQPELQS